MSDRSVIRWFFGAAMTALVVGLLFAPVAQAKDLPLYIEYAGTGHDLVPPVLGDPLADNIVMADAKGSFGAKSSVIIVKFTFPDPRWEDPCDAGFTFLGIAYARAVTTFQNGNQLFATVIPGEDSYMCLDMEPGNETDGSFGGSVTGEFIGGTGRFAGASGPFVSLFEGQNLSSAMWGEHPFRAISGSFSGTVTVPK